MKRTIELADDLIPEGWEPVAFRVPNQDDDYLLASGRSVAARENHAGGPRLIVRRVTDHITMLDRGRSILVANNQDGPYVERVLVHVAYGEKDYQYVCEAIDHRLSHQCWRFAKRLEA